MSQMKNVTGARITSRNSIVYLYRWAWLPCKPCIDPSLDWEADCLQYSQHKLPHDCNSRKLLGFKRCPIHSPFPSIIKPLLQEGVSQPFQALFCANVSLCTVYSYLPSLTFVQHTRTRCLLCKSTILPFSKNSFTPDFSIHDGRGTIEVWMLGNLFATNSVPKCRWWRSRQYQR